MNFHQNFKYNLSKKSQISADFTLDLATAANHVVTTLTGVTYNVFLGTAVILSVYRKSDYT